MEKSTSKERMQHTMELMEAALPFLDGKPKLSIELALKTSELLDTLQDFPPPSQLSACDLDEKPIDLEALLLGLQTVCSNSEKELIHMLLNFVKAHSIYQSYQAFRTKKGQHPTGPENPFGDIGSNMGSMIEFLTSSMNPEQQSQFESMSMLLQMMQMQ